MKHVAGILLALCLSRIWEDRAHAASPPAAGELEAGFSLPAGFEIRLVAAEPDLSNPMTLSVGGDGVLWVSESHTYRYGPEKSPFHPPANPVKRLELGPDGRVARAMVAAEGFPQPVMGLQACDGQLYATCLNELFVMEIGRDGRLSNRRSLVRDEAEPWNPFGFYRVILGPDGWLWLAIGDHPSTGPVTLTGADGRKVRFRGQSGGLVRCRRDGGGLEVVAHGLRAPYAFDFDPWGNIWLISNGEGSPNLYLEAIPGADYGYRSRTASYPWLAGSEPLSPPVHDLGPGANTAALHYGSAQFPPPLRGSVFVANWGSHGENPGNRQITLWHRRREGRDRRGSGDDALESGGVFLSCSDPRFRPTGLAHAPDGGLYLIDWHGRDDESDRTGRLYHIRYRGTPDAAEPPAAAAAPAADRDDPGGWADRLGDPHHLVREQATDLLAAAGEAALPHLERVARGGTPLAAAHAVWALSRMRTPAAAQALLGALEHPDGRVRAQALRQLRQASGLELGPPGTGLLEPARADAAAAPAPLAREILVERARPLLADPECEARVEAALAMPDPASIGSGLLGALELAEAPRMRYRIGFELARRGDLSALETLRDAADPERRRVGQIAVEIVRHEGGPLAASVASWPRESPSRQLGRDQLARLEAGTEPLGGTAAKLVALASILALRPEPAPLRLLRELVGDPDRLVQLEAIRAARLLGVTDAEVRRALAACAGPDAHRLVRLEAIYTLGGADGGPAEEDWSGWLNDPDPLVGVVALRALRLRARPAGLVAALGALGPELERRGGALSEEARITLQRLGATAQGADPSAPVAETPGDPSAMAAAVAARLGRGNPALGRLAFTTPQFACAGCHALEPGESRLGPSLAGIGAAAQPAHLIESILHPSRVIKTGWELESVTGADGRSYAGRVTVEGRRLTVAAPGAELVTLPLDKIGSRQPLPLSLMPEGLAAAMSPGELADLVAFLRTLKDL